MDNQSDNATFAYEAFVDESGTKQKARTPVVQADDFGVAVGLLLPSGNVSEFEKMLHEKLEFSPDDLTHNTDCGENAETNRQSVYKAIETFEALHPDVLKLVYEVIPALGFHNTEWETPRQLEQQAVQMRTSPIRISNNQDNPHAHAKLLAGVFAKVFACVMDQSGDSVRVNIDQVDEPIVSEAKKEICSLEKLSCVRQVNGFNRETMERLHGTVCSKIVGLSPLAFPHHQIRTLPKSNCCIFAADVIANALRYSLYDVAIKEGTRRLNKLDSIRDFRLAKFFISQARGSYPDASDTLYGGEGICL